MPKIYKCGACGYQGPCYGIPFIGSKSGVSAPFCNRCGINNKLTEVIKQEESTVHEGIVNRLITKYAEAWNRLAGGA